MSEEIVKFQVPVGHGCQGCVYATSSSCSHPDSLNRACSKLDHKHKHEFIFLTKDQAALARLRGTYK